MNLKRIRPNMTEIRTSGGDMLLVSYETPVALLDKDGHFYVTEKRWSPTTTRHVRTWLPLQVTGIPSQRPQSFFDTYFKAVA